MSKESFRIKVPINYQSYETDELKEALHLLKQKGIVFQESKAKNIMKISFDFDSTLSEDTMQTLCKKYIQLGADVYVTTSRSTEIASKPTNNDDLFAVTDALGIQRQNITFTGYKDKVNFVKDYDIHYDDDFEEIFLINQHHCKCQGFLFEQKSGGYIDY